VHLTKPGANPPETNSRTPGDQTRPRETLRLTGVTATTKTSPGGPARSRPGHPGGVCTHKAPHTKTPRNWLSPPSQTRVHSPHSPLTAQPSLATKSWTPYAPAIASKSPAKQAPGRGGWPGMTALLRPKSSKLSNLALCSTLSTAPRGEKLHAPTRPMAHAGRLQIQKQSQCTAKISSSTSRAVLRRGAERPASTMTSTDGEDLGPRRPKKGDPAGGPEH
jgi:hypothetical protein